MQPRASIIVVTYNSAAQIEACLAALDALAPDDHEVVVVDNASEDGTVARVRARFPAVRLLAERENHGFAGGVNRGVAAARGEWIALLNPDAIVEPGWLERITAPLADAHTGVTGGKVLDADGRIQSVGARLQMPVLLPAARGEGEVDAGQYDAPADVWSAHGAAMAFRRGVWEEIAGFDEGFFPAYLEESDFCERVRRAGYRVVTAPGAVLRHAEASSTGKYSAQFLYYFLRNRLRYALKWLAWPELWNSFRPAERERLRTAPLLQRRVAELVYTEGMTLTPPGPDERTAILETGRLLRAGTLPDDSVARVLDLLDEARSNAVHQETRFRSRLPFVARLRGAWNGVSTRWYVRPNFDQQTRYNLALERAARELAESAAARASAAALDAALLAWRLEQQHCGVDETER